MKRRVSAFIPYKFQDGEWRVFLQKRTEDAPASPGFFGLFGGGMEPDETPEQALLREVREELDYYPVQFFCFGEYEVEEKMGWVFGERVDETFEHKITVLEGQYGQWFTEAEIAAQEKVNTFSRLVLGGYFSNSKAENLLFFKTGYFCDFGKKHTLIFDAMVKVG